MKKVSMNNRFAPLGAFAFALSLSGSIVAAAPAAAAEVTAEPTATVNVGLVNAGSGAVLVNGLSGPVTVPAGSLVTLTATAGAGYQFAGTTGDCTGGWQGGSSRVRNALRDCTVSDGVATASFTADRYNVSVKAAFVTNLAITPPVVEIIEGETVYVVVPGEPLPGEETVVAAPGADAGAGAPGVLVVPGAVGPDGTPLPGAVPAAPGVTPPGTLPVVPAPGVVTPLPGAPDAAGPGGVPGLPITGADGTPLLITGAGTMPGGMTSGGGGFGPATGATGPGATAPGATGPGVVPGATPPGTAPGPGAVPGVTPPATAPGAVPGTGAPGTAPVGPDGLPLLITGGQAPGFGPDGLPLLTTGDDDVPLAITGQESDLAGGIAARLTPWWFLATLALLGVIGFEAYHLRKRGFAIGQKPAA